MELPHVEMESLQGKHKKHGKHGKHEHHGHDKDIPDDWKEKCPKDEDWCDKFLLKIIKKKKVKELFGGVKPHKLTGAEKAIVKKACKEHKYKGKKWCKKVKELEVQLWDDRKQLREEEHGHHGHKRAANEEADPGTSLALWLTVGGLLLAFLVLGLVMYFYVFSGRKKEGVGKGSASKGSASKGGSKLKSRRSKSGKTGFKSAFTSNASGK